MSYKKEYNQIFETEQKIKELINESNKQKEQIVLKRLYELAQIGKSVFQKATGHVLYPRAIQQQLSSFNNWVSAVNIEILEIHEDVIEVKLYGHSYQTPFEQMKIPKEILSIDDRKFARKIRDDVKRQNIRLNRQEVLYGNYRIAKLENEMNRIKNLMNDPELKGAK